MRTIWHSLAWKEWHEHKWKLAALTAITVSVVVLALYEFTRDTFIALPGLVIACSTPLVVFIGAYAAAGERARGTLPFLQALPVPMSRVARHKLAFGLMTCIVPVLAAMLAIVAVYIIAKNFDDQSFPTLFAPFSDTTRSPVSVGSYLVGAGTVAALVVGGAFLWVAAIGVNRRDEISAGAWAILCVVAIWTVVAVTLNVVEHWWPAASSSLPGVLTLGLGALPGGILPLLTMRGQQGGDLASLVNIGLGLAAIVHVLLAVAFIKRYGRVANLGERSPRAVDSRTAQPRWLAPPRRTRLSAIAWKQYRESSPVLLVGVAAVLCFVIAIVTSDFDHYFRNPKEIAALGVQFSIMFGTLIVLVVGIGLFLFDLEPQLNTFWRSRPIRPDTWFWTKAGTGLLVLFATFGLPAMVLAWLAGAWNIDGQAVYGATAIMLGCYLALYMTAVAATCLVRQPIYAAVLSIGAAMSAFPIFWVVWRGLALAGIVDRPSGGPFGSFSAAAIAGIMFTIAIASTVVAWLAIRNDWGWKNHG